MKINVIRKCISALLVVAMLLTLSLNVAFVADSANGTEEKGNVYIEVDKTEVNVGDEINVKLYTKDMNVISFTCGIGFDKDKLECESIVGADPEYPDEYDLSAKGSRYPTQASTASTAEEANNKGTVGFAFPGSKEVTYLADLLVTVTFKVKAAGEIQVSAYEDSDGTDGAKYDAASIKTVIATVPHSHTLVKTDAKSATCEADGNIEYYTCSGCEKIFSDKDGTKEITKADTVVKAIGHDWDEGQITTAATCEKEGVKTYTCKNDSTHTKTEAVKAIGHNYDEGQITSAATCEKDGVKTYTCKNDPTHTKTDVIQATGHDYGEWTVTTAAAEEGEGVETRVCKNDAAHVETRTIPKLESKTTLKTGNNAVLITLVVLISLAALAGITIFVKRILME